MNNKAKYISILAAFSLLTGCGAFNNSSNNRSTGTQAKTEASTAADTTKDCCEDKEKDCCKEDLQTAAVTALRRFSASQKRLM